MRARTPGGVAVIGDFEDERPAVAHLRHRRQRRRPVDRAVEGHEVVVGWPLLSWTCVVMTWPESASAASGAPPSRCAWPKSRQMPASSLELVEHVEQRVRRGEVVGHDLEGQPDAGVDRGLGERFDAAPDGAARRCRRAESPGIAAGPGARRATRQPRRRAASNATRVSAMASSRRTACVDAFEYDAAPDAVREALADRPVHAVGGEAELVEPAAHLIDVARVVVVDVRARGEHLDEVEAAARESSRSADG